MTLSCARPGQEPGVSSFHPWVIETRAFWPSSAAFSRCVSRSWIGSEVTGPQTNAHVDVVLQLVALSAVPQCRLLYFKSFIFVFI